MEFVVTNIYRKQGQFTDPKTNKVIAYDNTYPVLVAFDDNGEFKNVIAPKIKTANIPYDLSEGDFVKVYYNEYKQPEALIISRKGDNK